MQSCSYLQGRRYVLIISNKRSIFLASSILIQNLIVFLSQLPVLLIIGLFQREYPIKAIDFLLACLCVFSFLPCLLIINYLIGFLSIVRENLHQYLAPLMQAIFILSPIFWDQSLLESEARFAYELNLLYFPVWIFRTVLIGAAVPVLQFATLFILPIVLCLILLPFFSDIEQRIQMDGFL